MPAGSPCDAVGTVHSSNITPDTKTGIGTWTPTIRRAMHNGRSKDGSLLYPAFPYPNYTQITREDSDAILRISGACRGSNSRGPHTICVFPTTVSLRLAYGGRSFSIRLP